MLKPSPHSIMKLKNRVQGSKFEYFLNAVFYCIWRFQVRFSKFFRKIIYGLINFIGSIFLPSRFMQNNYDRQETANEDIERSFYGEEYSFCLNKSIYLMTYLSGGYFGIITFLLLAIGLKIDDNMNDVIALLIIVVSIIPGSQLAKWTVLEEKRYLHYFPEFKQNDAAWHRKWNRISILFCIGSVLSTILGIASFFVILICL